MATESVAASLRVPERPTIRDTLRGMGREAWDRFFRSGVLGLASQVAYSLIFALPPMLIVLGAIASLADRYGHARVALRLSTFIELHAPDQAKPLLAQLVKSAMATSGKTASLSAAVALLIALWSGSGGVGALVNACNRVNGVRDTRHFVVRRLVYLGLTVLMTVLIVGAFGLFVFGQRIGGAIADHFGQESTFTQVWNLLREPVAVVFLAFSLGLLYSVGPSIKQSPRWVVPGAAFGTVAVILLLVGFQSVLRFTNPASPYGAAGSVIVFIWFLYLTGLIFILGVLLNAVLGSRYDHRRLTDLAQHPEKRLDPAQTILSPVAVDPLPAPSPATLTERRPAFLGFTPPVIIERTSWRSFTTGAVVGAIGAVVVALALLPGRVRRQRGS